MATRVFPFWILLRPGVPPAAVSAVDPEYAVAFTSLDRARSYASRERAITWEFKLVCRMTFAALADRLRFCNLRGLCFDPDARGIGERLDVADIERFLQPPDVESRPRAHRYAG